MSTTRLENEVRALLEYGVGGDPYPTYTRLRHEVPVFVFSDTCVVSTFDEVKSMLRSPAMFQSTPHRPASRADLQVRLVDDASERERALYANFVAFQSPTLTRTDGEVHDRIRGSFRSSFSSRTIESWRPIVQRLTDELLDGWFGESVIDAVTSLALPLPLCVILDLIGVPRRDAEVIRQWSTEIFPGGTDLETTHAAIEGFRIYLPQLIDGRPRDGSAVVLEALLDAHAAGDLAEHEVASNVVNLLFAGHETTTSLIGSGLYSLLSDRQQWDRLRAEPSRVPAAIEELLRFESPVQYLGRSAATDVELGGVSIPGGTRVIPLLGSANRDSGRFPTADVLDVHRDASGHLAFGFGPHYCLGAHLARLEADVAFTSLLDRHPHLELVEEAPAWRESRLFRGLEKLLVRPSR